MKSFNLTGVLPRGGQLDIDVYREKTVGERPQEKPALPTT
jgi:hypothetical protein